jgi:hypothetical protein
MAKRPTKTEIFRTVSRTLRERGVDGLFWIENRSNTDHDLALSVALLNGILRRRPIRFEYLAGKTEKEARRALARLLRSDRPLDELLRYALASLFDPDPDKPFACSFGIASGLLGNIMLPKNPRHLEFASRRGKKRHPETIRNRFIAWEMGLLIAKLRKEEGIELPPAAAAKAIKEHLGSDIDERHLMNIWNQHKGEVPNDEMLLLLNEYGVI